MRHHIAASAAAAIVLGAAVTGCGTELGQDLLGDVAAEGLQVAAAEAFASAGFPIQDQLDCEVEGVGESDVSADCTGTTEQGADVAFTGSYDTGDTDFTDGVQGTFTGSVEGTEVFSTDCLGC